MHDFLRFRGSGEKTLRTVFTKGELELAATKNWWSNDVNLIMALVWLGMALILVAGAWFDLDLGSFNAMKQSPIMPMLATIMCLYNFSRWWYLNIQTRYEKNPPQVKPRVAKSTEYLPEFDFTKDPPNDAPPQPPKPSSNGEDPRSHHA